MIRLLAIWFTNALALLVISWIIPGFMIANFYNALMVALVLGFVNAIIRPVVLVLTLPINLLTLGLFTFVVNALMLLFVQSLVKGFFISDFTSALLAAIVLWIISFVSNYWADRLKY